MLADLRMYARFALGLRKFLRQTITVEEARQGIRLRMAEREPNFLRVIEKGIFGNPQSPYLYLLNMAKIDMGDIRLLVRDKGLEGTLQALKEAGVYVTFEEFKGRKPIVRGDKVFPVRVRDFDNPHLKPYYTTQTGGSTGAGVRVSFDLDGVQTRASQMMVTQDAHHLTTIPVAIWRGILPDDSGLSTILSSARRGNIPKRWFSPITNRDVRPLLKNRLATQYIVSMGRLFGFPIPRPELVSLDNAGIIARWMADTLQTHGACMLSAHVSMALRVALVAQELGLNLTGATFWGGGEPPTPAKVREITCTGAKWVPTYFFAEAGAVGLGCAQPVDATDVHFMRDSLAFIQCPRQVPSSTITVDALLYTTLLPEAPKLLLNVETDDYAIVEERHCGCPLDELGYTTHLRSIKSFSKLTGEGVTLVGSEMVYILEKVLPSKFGGGPLDYQLVEEEDGRGFSRLNLRVHPRIEISDENTVIATLLQALEEGSIAADSAKAIWRQAGTLSIQRKEPFTTSVGKQMPIHRIRKLENESLSSTEHSRPPEA